MPSLVIPDTVQLRLYWSALTAPLAVNVLHLIDFGAPAVDQDLADDVGAIVVANFTSSGLKARIADDITLETVGVRSLDTANQPEYLFTAAVAGTDIADPLPYGNAICVTLRTAMAGQSYRGRVYLPGFTEASNTSTNRVLAATGVDCVDFLTENQTDLGAIGLNLCVASRTLLESNPVTSITTRDLIWDTQRRRNLVGG